jgi:hypothetical protein
MKNIFPPVLVLVELDASHAEVRLSAFDSRILRRIFGPKRDDV